MSRRKRFTRNLGRPLVEPLPATIEWVRFEHESAPFGVFHYTRVARTKLSSREAAHVRRLVEWFNRRLSAPPDWIDEERFWFRAEAGELVDRARRLAALVARAGFPIVERCTTKLPGGVRWEDAHQVAVLLDPHVS